MSSGVVAYLLAVSLADVVAVVVVSVSVVENVLQKHQKVKMTFRIWQTLR